MANSLLTTWFSLLLLLAIPAGATPPRAALLAQAGSDPIIYSCNNLYGTAKDRDLVAAHRSGWVEFGNGAFTPTLIHFVNRIVRNPPARTRLLEPPVLVLMPGDTVTILHNVDRNTFQFKGRHQAELDFCVRLWRGALSLDGMSVGLGEPVDGDSTITYHDTVIRNLANRKHLTQYLQLWQRLRLEGDARLAQLRRTPGIRPEVAACLGRQIRLRLFSMLLSPLLPSSRRDTLRTPPDAYRDTVAAQWRGVLAMQALPAAASQGVGWALSQYAEYQCVLARQYPAAGASYKMAKQLFSGFHRAWVCYLILEDGQQRQNLSYYIQDYARWVKPHDEFLKVLRGGPPVPLRSYPHAAFSDSLVSPVGSPRHLTDLLAAYRGKVILLDLWASWCVPCREEIPLSIAAAKRYGKRGLVVLYLSIDEDPTAWRGALKQLPAGAGLQYRFIRPGSSAFRQEFDVRSVPRYMLLDRRGTVRNPNSLRPGDVRFGTLVEELL
ncbi:TlpA disulfide reductase family protein [Hymenobacter sp. BT559]|uniref:TlpA family protein disulfide reductase n=1 Tax=Hymenobacter sp. BT559 TaxID=2795729 RepID=UPI0018EDC34B|nr:TlpA disulfide reductase family protein [Hymenobacter sp. BT559]MBJ6143526.1 TlpA family protein disulfide reductase [Hymenobacter sp. BT559]